MTAGEAIPYNFLGDNVVMALFVLNLVGMAYVFLMNGSSIVERAKSMFYHGKQSNPYTDRTHITKLCNLLLYMQTIFYCSIIAFGGIQYTTPLTRGATPYIILAAFYLLIAVALLMKRGLYDICNLTLLSATIAREWKESYFFTIKLSGFILLPLAICIIFVKGFSITYYTIYLLFATLLYAVVVVYSAKKIIFKKKCIGLDIFLYLCALEFLPMAILWRAIHVINAFLTTKI